MWSMGLRELLLECCRLARRRDPESRRALAEAYWRYVSALPPEQRRAAVCIMSGGRTVVVRRDEIPKRLLKDDEFYELFRAYLLSIEPHV